MVSRKMEFGPRALGNRSILADPRKENMKEIINKKIKKEEKILDLLLPLYFMSTKKNGLMKILKIFTCLV